MKFIVINDANSIYPLYKINEHKKNSFKVICYNGGISKYFKVADLIYIDDPRYLKFLYEQKRYLDPSLRNTQFLIPVKKIKDVCLMDPWFHNEFNVLLNGLQNLTRIDFAISDLDSMIASLRAIPMYRNVLMFNLYEMDDTGSINSKDEMSVEDSIFEPTVGNRKVILFGNDASINDFDFETELPKLRALNVDICGVNRIYERAAVDKLFFVDFQIAKEINARKDLDFSKTTIYSHVNHLKEFSLFNKMDGLAYDNFVANYGVNELSISKSGNSLEFAIKALWEKIYPKDCEIFIYGARLKWDNAHHFWHANSSKSGLPCADKNYYGSRLKRFITQIKQYHRTSKVRLYSLQKDCALCGNIPYIPYDIFLENIDIQKKEEQREIDENLSSISM
ncbi:MAG TPA: hypothetical protein PLA71_01040 [Saccharofermentans sp.]|nr:hypothetical protein [Saccharofermentans sp.]